MGRTGYQGGSVENVLKKARPVEVGMGLGKLSYQGLHINFDNKNLSLYLLRVLFQPAQD
jgi:hypothetical protein